MYSKHRLEGLSDAIFAIVMTLLILDLKVPADVVPGHLWEALRHDGVSWLSFGLTFFISARFWVLQHQVFDAVDTIGQNTVAITFIFLGLVTILPFSTSLLSHHIVEPLAFCLYFLNQFAIAAALTAKLEIAAARGHLHPSAKLSRLRLSLYVMCVAMGCGVITALTVPMRWVSVGPAAIAFLGRRAQRFIKPDRDLARK